MDESVEKFIDGLFTKEATEQPSDTQKPEELDMSLPEWYDEKKFNQARRFYWDHCFQFSSSMLLGLVMVFAVPSILKVLISTRRSNSAFTSYRRYLSTVLHTQSWFEYDLKPGSISWKSLFTVRVRHIKAGLGAKSKGLGTVSQRDLALTQFGFIGISMLKPDKFGIRQMEAGDWEAYNHFWRTIGHLIGLEDKYNICRPTFEETRQVCQILLERVFTPCLENVPEYFEHMARAMLDGMWCVNPSIDVDGLMYWTKYMADVPGYVYNESDRYTFQNRLRTLLKGKPEDTGVEVNALIPEPLVEGTCRSKRLLYLHDYDKMESVPEYKSLNFGARRKMAFNAILGYIYSTWLGRWYFNLNFRFSVLLMKYFPYLAFFRFGFFASFVNIFEEDPIDNTELKPNSEYLKPKPPLPWYKEILSF
ncbi:unnamed protein product [Colias eurytheme]|nr:unnamed protein product [Colias eurytheme]